MYPKYLHFLMQKSYKSYIKSFILTSYILLLTSYVTNAQWYDPLKVNTKATDIYLQAIANAQNAKYSVAIKMINDALKIDPKFVDAYLSVAGIYADIKNYFFKPQNLGDNINSKDPEYYPSITIDGKKIVFTRRVHGSDAKGNELTGNEDFYESELIDGEWSKAKPLEGNINSSQYNEGAQNISQDGKWLIFTGCLFPEGMGSCDLYISYLTKQGWSQPENLGPNVNSEFWESSPSLSPDKKDLYFSSSVPGGFGGKDIWVCHRNADGKWGPAQNLGAEINTAGDEGSPFIHADNQTLYFNSNGHQGYSEKADLFVSHKQPDGTWSKPENLGYPINTIDEEGSLIVSADGKTAYYASDRSD